MAFPTPEDIARFLSPITDRWGLDIELIKAHPAGKKSTVQVRVDADDAPTLDDLERVSAEISDALDAAEENGELNFGAGYTLEVSTPGTDLPLTLPRHFRRNRHRLVTVNGQVARLGAMSEDNEHIILVTKAKKKLSVATHPVSSDATIMVEIEFSAPAADELELTEMTFDDAQQWQEDHK
ncbi:ribosome maturation factor RimP [Corynebacterium uterequi]|uniref:Ribosome maturation factor RimP n=1 Tax=Corynebacterium uterequi TaxID=1072256 RepID=A0A0G3HD72_9CORY|nr:ribosome maturation factor RimP [Corynebacterium uterequi]AKK11331.1 hypothetical protein CUTER_06710 [Corynebacterium uterequi]